MTKWLSKSEWIKKKIREKNDAVKELTENWPDCCKNCELMKKPIEQYAQDCANPRIKCPLVPTPNFKECQNCKKLKAEIESWRDYKENFSSNSS